MKKNRTTYIDIMANGLILKQRLNYKNSQLHKDTKFWVFSTAFLLTNIVTNLLTKHIKKNETIDPWVDLSKKIFTENFQNLFIPDKVTKPPFVKEIEFVYPYIKAFKEFLRIVVFYAYIHGRLIIIGLVCKYINNLIRFITQIIRNLEFFLIFGRNLFIKNKNFIKFLFKILFTFIKIIKKIIQRIPSKSIRDQIKTATKNIDLEKVALLGPRKIGKKLKFDISSKVRNKKRMEIIVWMERIAESISKSFNKKNTEDAPKIIKMLSKNLFSNDLYLSRLAYYFKNKTIEFILNEKEAWAGLVIVFISFYLLKIKIQNCFIRILEHSSEFFNSMANRDSYDNIEFFEEAKNIFLKFKKLTVEIFIFLGLITLPFFVGVLLSPIAYVFVPEGNLDYLLRFRYLILNFRVQYAQRLVQLYFLISGFKMPKFNKEMPMTFSISLSENIENFILRAIIYLLPDVSKFPTDFVWAHYPAGHLGKVLHAYVMLYSNYLFFISAKWVAICNRYIDILSESQAMALVDHGKKLRELFVNMVQFNAHYYLKDKKAFIENINTGL